MIKITDYMTKPVLTAKADESIRSAVAKMDKHNIGSVVITEGKKPVGIVTERDIMRKVVAKNLDLDKTPISKIMTSKVESVMEGATLIEVASIMKNHSLRRIIVTNKKGELTGIVTSKDLIDILCT